MNNNLLVISGLLTLMVVSADAMQSEHEPRMSNDPFYHSLYTAIRSGYPWDFMETLNTMEAQGHALDGEDYDSLQDYARERGFEKIAILEDTVYQKLSAAVLKDDVGHFNGYCAKMASVGAVLSDDHLYWLLDLAMKKEATRMQAALAAEFQRRGIQTG